ncbi:MAG: sigma-70 family RNA polymerase sigma factor [Thermoguttaceae bacterium]
MGDRSAFAALVQLWEQRLLTIAYRVVGNVHDAEEVRQNVFLRLAQSPHQLRDPARFASWLRRCVVNEAITWLRRRGNEAIRQSDLDDAVACKLPSPSEQAAASERSQRLLEAMSQLDADSRALISLRFDECMTIRQIAEVLERPPMTVHSQLTRALGQLRRLLTSDRQQGAT